MAHGFSNGDSVTISGTTNATFNTTVTIGNVSATTFTFGSFNGPLSATGGSVYKNSSTKAFVTTSTAHALTTGQKVVISGATQTGFNTAAAVAITVLDTTNFTYTLAAAQSGVATGTIIYTPPVATATAAGHGFINGASITIAGASPATYNGTFTIKNVTTSTFDYNFSGADPVLPNATMADPVTPTPITATGTSNIRDTLVRWIRGLDTQDENGFKVNGADTDVRPSIHADILHSRPVVLNFAKTGDPDNVYVFYGGNDGIFRATKGGQLSTDGNELWGFIPQEFFKKFRRLYNNDPAVKYPSTPVSNTTAIPRDYFWDGPVGSYMERDNAGVVTKAWLFIAVRRGGRFIYALDVTTPSRTGLEVAQGMHDRVPGQLRMRRWLRRARPDLVATAGHQD